jgi:uncharacterized lipoprotein YmbA
MTIILRAAIGILALALAACASSPATLVALPPAPHPVSAHTVGEGFGSSVLLRHVSLPAYLRDYSIVVGRNGNTLAVSDNTEWAERLSDAVRRVLQDALSQRLGASRVLIAGDHRIPDADLTVEFFALDPQQRTLRLDAAWVFACTARDASSHAGRTALQVPLDSSTAPAIANAAADALGRLADVLAKEARCLSVDRRALAQ